MIRSKLYSKYFPVKDRYTNFTQEEIKELCKWARDFEGKVALDRHLKEIKGLYRIRTYDMSEYEEKKMIEAIESNMFSDKQLLWLNAIIYGNKYNKFLSMFIPLPILPFILEKFDQGTYQ